MDRVLEVSIFYVAPIGLTVTLALEFASLIPSWRRNGTRIPDELYDRYKERLLQEDKGAADLAIMALRSAIVLNGAASVAVLAIVSTLFLDKELFYVRLQLVDVLSLLLSGTFVAVLAAAFGYLRMFYSTVHWNVWGFITRRTKSQISSHALCMQSHSFALWPPTPILSLPFWTLLAHWARKCIHPATQTRPEKH